VALLVQLGLVALDVGGDLLLQRGHQHPTGALAGQLVQQHRGL